MTAWASLLPSFSAPRDGGDPGQAGVLPGRRGVRAGVPVEGLQAGGGGHLVQGPHRLRRSTSQGIQCVPTGFTWEIDHFSKQSLNQFIVPFSPSDPSAGLPFGDDQHDKVQSEEVRQRHGDHLQGGQPVDGGIRARGHRAAQSHV